MNTARLRERARPAPPVIMPEPPAPPAPIGLIAAGGRLPLLVAEGIRKAGHGLRTLGLAGQYPRELITMSERFVEAGPLRVGSWGPRLRKLGVRHAVMVGRIDKAGFLYNWRAAVRAVPDARTMRILFNLRHDLRSHRLLNAAADELSRHGVELIDSTTHIGEHMADVGAMTKTKPSVQQHSDVEFGWPILQELLRLDIGQAIAVRHSDVVAVEAIEGTDRMIARAGELCAQGGWVLLKGCRAGHDRRADVPTIGTKTVENVHRAGGRCIAVAAEDVILVDKQDTIALGDKLGVSIIGVPPA